MLSLIALGISYAAAVLIAVLGITVASYQFLSRHSTPPSYHTIGATIFLMVISANFIVWAIPIPPDAGFFSVTVRIAMLALGLLGFVSVIATLFAKKR